MMIQRDNPDNGNDILRAGPHGVILHCDGRKWLPRLADLLAKDWKVIPETPKSGCSCRNCRQRCRDNGDFDHGED